MSHIFISYNHEDSDFIEILRSKLEQAGFVVWTDSTLRGGEDWRRGIDRAIKDAFALIAVMTPEAKASEYVTYEWAFAVGAEVEVIPILLKRTNLHPRLESLQHLDFTNRQSRPWDKLISVLQEAESSKPEVKTPKVTKAAMGTFFTKCKIENIVDRKKSAVIPKMLVDCGSEYTWIPATTLEKIGVKR